MIHSIRRIQTDARFVHLTFDDGPDGNSTPAVLDILKRTKVRATFFLVADRARENPDLVKRILADGHAIGNHSVDHQTWHYFRGARHLKKWIQSAAQEFRQMGIDQTVGFRPPVGIVTPPLRQALLDLGEPLILWNERFYDAVFPWKKGSAENSARELVPGSIVLLHDRQPPDRLDDFLSVLEVYIAAIRARGFEFAPLKRGDLLAQMESSG
ncbi:MAG: polysaccharide deacetylase family protein [Bdellovibrionales bacterium]